MRRAALLVIIYALTACSYAKERELAACKVSGEHVPGGEIGMEIHLANCMTAAGYRFVEAKVGETAKTSTERECFADWDAAHFKPECYRPL